MLFLPGYTLIEVLFPTKEIDNIERTALSIGTSLTSVSLEGLAREQTLRGPNPSSLFSWWIAVRGMRLCHAA
jgi:uncharacterized membrane protein